MARMRGKYVAELKRRGKESHVYKKYQLIGLEIAQILGDEKHKALYIKLAKEHDADTLMRLAKDVADRTNVKNKGAYFMTVLKEEVTAQYRVTKKQTKTK
ncbi:MAG TPA: hypothetical protein VMA75_02800 [Candidatus Paceibacterota bacterium]|nr:hypothetical protein [Candidatus Paceibacterota bacterium]